MTLDQRKKLVEGVILSRLYLHLEVVSTGRKVDLEALQRVQNAAMCWVIGEGRRAFWVRRSGERLGWLDMGQVAAKATILAALKILWAGDQGDMVNRLVKIDKKGTQQVKTVGEEELRRMNIRGRGDG